MKFGQIFSGVREFCDDAPESVITTPQIAFFVMNRFDYYGSQLIHAGKGLVEYKVTKNPTQREEVYFETFSFGQPKLVRRLVSFGEEERWEMLDVVTNIAEFTARENRGMRAIYFLDNKYLLSYEPSSQETLEFWGERAMFSGLSISTEVKDVPALFHHLVMESAAIPALNKLLKKPEYNNFVAAQKMDLKESVRNREIIWQNYLSSEADVQSSRERDEYSPMRDDFYRGYF